MLNSGISQASSHTKVEQGKGQWGLLSCVGLKGNRTEDSKKRHR